MRHQVLLMGLPETFISTKVQYAFALFSRVECLSSSVFSILSRMKCPILAFFLHKKRQKSMTLPLNAYMKCLAIRIFA